MMVRRTISVQWICTAGPGDAGPSAYRKRTYPRVGWEWSTSRTLTVRSGAWAPEHRPVNFVEWVAAGRVPE